MAHRKVTVDLTKKLGPVRAVNGVNVGAKLSGNDFARTKTTKKQLGKLRIPYSRLHDAPLFNPGMKLVDVPFVFPDFGADENDPKNYYFVETDDYLKEIMDTGAEIYYRLGVSIEHMKNSYKTFPPADFEKWARICANIIRHYNEGWADGFTHNIKYWEIWNEADIGRKMWAGTKEQFFELYITAAKLLKKEFPSLMIGGPGLCSGESEYVNSFLDACRKADAPLDFFSWHKYTGNVEDLASVPYRVRKTLDSYGFTVAESHLNEWRYVSFDWQKMANDAEYTMRQFEFSDGPAGAAANAAALIAWQDAPLDMANFYHATSARWGMFDQWGIPNKNYYAFLAFARLLEAGERVECKVEGGSDIYMAAATAEDGKKVTFLCANPGINREWVAMDLKGAGLQGAAEVETNCIDLTNNLDHPEQKMCDNISAGFDFVMPPLSVMIVEVKPVAD